MRLAAKSADKMARGWSGADVDGALPDADLLAFEFGLFQVRIVMVGCLLLCLWEAVYVLRASQARCVASAPRWVRAKHRWLTYFCVRGSLSPLTSLLSHLFLTLTAHAAGGGGVWCGAVWC